MPYPPPYITYSGISAPNGQVFFIDGDFTRSDPCGMPVISFPLKGDSILANNDLMVLFPNGTLSYYGLVKLGDYPNIHPWNPTQWAMVLEQEFIVAQAYYIPLALNTPYYAGWAMGWQGYTNTGYPIPPLSTFYLVEECALEDIGAGLSKIRRKFATIPLTRCEIEQYVYTFPGIAKSTIFTSIREPVTQNVMSRLQYDYFIFDDLGILGLPLFNAKDGRRLDSSTGLYPNGIVIPAMRYFSKPADVYTNNGFFIGNTTESLIGTGSPTADSLPDADSYIEWSQGVGTSNGLPAEICIESSTFTRWMGNIWERKTRFCLAQ